MEEMPITYNKELLNQKYAHLKIGGKRHNQQKINK